MHHTTPEPHRVPSPAVRDLLTLAAHPHFDRTRAQVERLKGCTRPVQLIGHTTTHETTTGEILSSYRSADQPTGRILLPCGDRRATRCPACSRVYAADTYHLIHAGLCGGKVVPETVRTHPRVFATLTAPSFGPVHNRPTTSTGNLRSCRCGIQHPTEDPRLGTPLDPATYDYCGAILFNASAGTLWARFTTQLRREIAARAGLSQRALPAHLRLSFAKVAEYQKRGVVHFHAVIRLDGPEGADALPPAWATAPLLADAIPAAAARVHLTVTSDTIGDRELTWGTQTDVREITPGGAEGPLTDRGVAAYVAKYATKGAEATGTIDRPLPGLRCNRPRRNPRLSICHPTHPRTPAHLLEPRPVPRIRPPRPVEMGPHARLPGPLLHQVPPLLHHPRSPPQRSPHPCRCTSPSPPRGRSARPPHDPHGQRMAIPHHRLQPRRRTPGRNHPPQPDRCRTAQVDRKSVV